MSIDLRLPGEAPELDPLQTEGAASLLSKTLDQVSGADGPDGSNVDVDRYWVGAYPEGAVVLLVVDADSLEIAEAAAHEILQERSTTRNYSLIGRSLNVRSASTSDSSRRD